MIKKLTAIAWSKDGHIIPGNEYELIRENETLGQFRVKNSMGFEYWYDKKLFYVSSF
jgi:hypothetical protein